MPFMNRLFLGLVLVLLSGYARADDTIHTRLLGLFTQFDADHNKVLSTTEQTQALAAVKTRHGEKWVTTVRGLFQAAATTADGTVSEAQWQQQVAAFDRSTAPAVAKPAPAAPAPPVPTEACRLAMADGVHLATDVYLPPGQGPFPVVFTRTPYNKNNAAGSSVGLNRGGYALVAQDMRGRFGSEGENLPFIGCGWGEHRDGADTLAWIRKQSWCNGRICTTGGSAGGITQNLLAGAAPEGLTAQYINVAAASLYHDAAYVGGAWRKNQIENWLTGNKFDPKAVPQMHEHPNYDDFWRQLDTTLKFSMMTAPAVHVGGWFDTFAQGTIDEFCGRQYHGAEGARGRQKLVMGPWTHGGWRKEGVGELQFPNSQAPEAYSVGRWLEYHLKGVDNGIMKEPAVAYYVMGDTSQRGAPGNAWRFTDEWPVPAADTPYYFTADGQLTPDRPTAAGVAEYTFDPANPCPTVGGNNLNQPAGPRNQNTIESRKDVALFTSAPLAQPLEVTGRVKAQFFVDSSAADTDLSVRLCDVYPDGKSYLMAEGMLRLRYRKSFSAPEPLTPGRIEPVTVTCWSTSLIFNREHRIRLTVTSSNYPRFDLNPGTGKPWSETGEKVRQTNRIHCGAEQASGIILPVVTAKSVSSAKK